MMQAILTGVATLTTFVACCILEGSSFLPETRWLLGDVYFLIATTAACGAAVLWQLEENKS